MLGKRKNIDTVKTGEEEAYYERARDWETDRQARFERSERRAWLVAAVAVGIAAISVVAVASLFPFKRVVPYVFTVDKANGNVELVSAADNRKLVEYQELVDKHWAQRYVKARESYYYRFLQQDYDFVLALSSDRVGADYNRQYTGDNARHEKLGQNTELHIKILSVSLNDESGITRAVVRFERTTVDVKRGLSSAPQFYVATLAYEYKPSMFGKEKNLIMNPLGYTVTGYRLDAELNSDSSKTDVKR